MQTDLKGQVALVTGGTRGIGREICLALARCGARVFVNFASRADAAESVVQEIRAAGGAADAIGFDVASSAAVDQAVDAIREKAGKLDILVNNAGIAKNGLFVRFKDEDWFQTLHVNLSGAFFCSRAATKIMMKARYGRIVHIGSVVGEMGNEGQAAYAASKAGLVGLAKAMAREFSSRSITVNVVTPGFIETDMTAGLDDKVKADHLAHIPLGRYGQAGEVASLVTFLCSREAGYITGQVVGVNGGMRM